MEENSQKKSSRGCQRSSESATRIRTEPHRHTFFLLERLRIYDVEDDLCTGDIHCVPLAKLFLSWILQDILSVLSSNSPAEIAMLKIQMYLLHQTSAQIYSWKKTMKRMSLQEQSLPLTLASNLTPSLRICYTSLVTLMKPESPEEEDVVLLKGK